MKRALVLAVVILGAAVSSRSQTITGFPIPENSYRIVAGPDGALWYTDSEVTGHLGRIDTQGNYTSYPDATPAFALTVGPDGAIWFTTMFRIGSTFLGYGGIGRLDPSTGAITTYPVPNSGNTAIAAITAGKDGNRIWFSEPGPSQIGSIETTGPHVGRVQEYSTPTPNSLPSDLIADPDGNIWFVSFGGPGLSMLNPKTDPVTITEYGGIPSIYGIAWGPDNAIWLAGGVIFRVDPRTCDSQAKTCAPETFYPPNYHRAFFIAPGPDGNLWFTEYADDQIGSIDPRTGAITEYPWQGAPTGITRGPDNNMWFGENFQNEIGVVILSGGCPSIVFSPGTLPVGQAGVNYPSTTLTPQAGLPPYSFDVSGLPDGMAWNSDGQSITIGGVPSSPFSGFVQFSAVDANLCGSQESYPLTIACASPPPIPTIQAPITVSPHVAGYVAGVAPVIGETYSWSISNGTITSPTDTNQVTFTAGSGDVVLSVTVTTGLSCSSTASVTIPATGGGRIDPGAFTFMIGQPNSLRVGFLTAGRTPPFTIQILNPLGAYAFPSGVVLYDNGDGTGTLTGTPGPDSAGVYLLRLRLNFGDGSAWDWDFTLTVVMPPVPSYTGPTPGGGTATAAIAAGNDPSCQFSQVSFIYPQGEARSPSTPPPINFTFPRGMVNFVTTGTCNSPLVITINYSGTTLPSNFYKYGSQPGPTPPDWYRLNAAQDPQNIQPGEFSISGNTITIKIADGGPGDDDGIANGVIVDPGGPVIITSAVPPTFTDGPPPATATIGVPYPAFQYMASGTQPVAFSVTSGGLPPGLSISSGVVSGIPTVPGTYSGTVTATNGYPPDATQDFTIVVAPAASADVSIGKTVDNSAPDVGQNVVFTVAASNSGPSDATGVQVTDLLPAGLSFVSASVSQGAYGSGTGLWSVGSIANGGSATLSITATVTQTGSIVNTATKTAQTEPDPNTANDSATASINGQPTADVGVNKSADNATPNVGDLVVFTVSASDGGPQDATGVQVVDLLPAGLSFVSASPSQGSYDSATGLWDVGAISKGASATLAITASVTQVGTITNTAIRTAGNEFDPNPANDQKSVTINGQPSADVRLAKAVSNASPQIGDQVTYTITASDDGPSPASGVQVTDLLPGGLTFLSASASQGSYDSSTGLWNVGSLAKNASATLSIVATVFQIGSITNTAAKSGQIEHDPNASNDSASVAITASGVAPAITTQPSSQAVCAGQSVSFVSTASGNPTPTLQWQVSTNGGGSFSDLPGATSTTLTFAAAAGDDGKQYRALFTNAAGSATSNVATLTVHTAPAVTTQPASQTVAAGQSVSFSAAASGSPAPSVQWQVSTDGGALFSDIAGANSSTLSFTASGSQSGYLYRAVVTNACGSATTNAATLTVTTGCAPLAINPPALHDATAGKMFRQELSVAGEDERSVTFSLGAGAPAWLGITGRHVLFGRPPAPGQVTFTVSVMDTNGCAGSRTYTLVIDCPEIALLPEALPDGVLGRKYSHAVFEYGGLGNATFAVTDGSLPPGLVLATPADGDRRPARVSLAMLSGRPTAAGSYGFTITATDSNGCTGSRRYKLVILSTGRGGD